MLPENTFRYTRRGYAGVRASGMSKPEPRPRESFKVRRSGVWFILEKLPRSRHTLNCSMSAPWSKIPSRTKGQDERSSSALIEALTTKVEDDEKDTGGGHQPLIKDRSVIPEAKVAL